MKNQLEKKFSIYKKGLLMIEKSKIEHKINLINKKIDLLKKIKRESLKNIFSKIKFNSGKKIRGLLLLTTAESCGKKINSDLLTYAACVELLHLGSLIHDDVIDNSEKRRGVFTLYKIIGKELSILAGDYLFSLVSKVIFNKKKSKIFNVFINSVNDICSGAIEEIYNKNNIELTEREYLNIIQQKTGSLICASVEIGALEAKVNIKTFNYLKKYGFFCGIAFQIIDDILDITGNEKELGKPVGSDICEGKITLPLLKALKNSSKEQRKYIEKIYRKGRTKENLNKIINFIFKNKGIECAKAEAENYIKKAKAYLKKAELKGDKKELFYITDYILNRTS